MKSPLSTSSSEDRVPWYLRLRAVWLALAILLAVEFGLARQDWVWSWVPASNSGVVDAMESQVIAQAPAPQVLLMGSSRIRDGVAPRLLEQELGLPEGSALNLGLTRGTPYDAALLYRRNRDRFRGADLLVVGVEDWSFNAALSPNERYRRFASLPQRVGVYDEDWTRSLVAGWFWRTYDAQGPLRRLLKSAVKGRKSKLPLAEDGRVKWRAKEKEVGPAQVDVSLDLKRFYRGYTRRQGLEDQLRDLVAMAREDDTQVILVQVPLRDAYLEQARQEYPEGLALYREALASFEGVPQEIWWGSSALGIQQDWFYDYGHLTPPGAAVFTAALAERVRPMLKD
jgi:hypothetical protein